MHALYILLGHPEAYKLIYSAISYSTSHGWYFCSFVHRDTVKQLSKAVATNLPPSQSLELLKTLGKGMGETMTQFHFRKNFVLGVKELANRSVEQFLERIKRVLYIKLVKPSCTFMS